MDLIERIIELKKELDEKQREIHDHEVRCEREMAQLTSYYERIETEREQLITELTSFFEDSSDAVLKRHPPRGLIDRILELKHILDRKESESRCKTNLAKRKVEFEKINATREALLVELAETKPSEPFNMAAALKKAIPKTSGIAAANLTEKSVEEAEERDLANYTSSLRDAYSPKIKELLTLKQKKEEADSEEIQRRVERRGGTRRKPLTSLTSSSLTSSSTGSTRTFSKKSVRHRA